LPVCALFAGLLALTALARGEVRIEGLEAPELTNVRSYLRLDEEPCDAPVERIRQRYRGLEQRVREALQPYGWYEPEVALQLRQGEGCWQVDIAVELGEPVRIEAVDLRVSGAAEDDAEFLAALPRDRLRPGERLRHGDYEAVKKALVDAAGQRGYFDYRFDATRVAVSRAERSARIELAFDSGPRYRYGAIGFESDVLRPELLARFPEFDSGEPYDQADTLTLYRDLLSSDFFDSVQIERTERDDALVDIDVLTAARKRWGLGAGLGYGTDTGPVITTDVVNRRLNRRGHRATWLGKLSPAEQSTSVEYRIPGRRPATDWYSAFAGVKRRRTESLETEGSHAGVRRGFQRSRLVFETWFLEYTSERLRENDSRRREQALVPGVRWGLRLGPEDPRPRRGLRTSLEVAGASDSLFSATRFLRAHLAGKAILPFGARGRLLLRGEVGRLAADSFDGVPPSWRFYAGGDASVRGYDYQSLGPEDINGEATGGSRLLVGSAEVDLAVTERWSGALFVDTGSVSVDDFGDEPVISFGTGVRWYSPLGPVRLDLALPQQGDDGFRIHISLGPDL